MIDPKAGIIGSLQYALRRLGREVPAADSLHWVIGPSLRTTFAQLDVPAECIGDGLAFYREHYRAGAMYDFRVYDGIDAALGGLAGLGHRLIVATAKPHVFANPILERAGLARHFAAVHGAELDGRHDDKADLIAHIGRSEGIAATRTVMIGDRRFDVAGAQRNGIRTIGVLWGYGSREELAEAGAIALCPSPSELMGTIASIGAEPA